VSIVDAFPFPFADPRAQELLRVMMSLYRTRREAVALVEQHQIEEADLPPDLTTRQLWHELLDKAAAKGTTRAIVAAARAEFPTNPRVAFLDALLAGEPAPLSAEPADAAGAPKFIVGTDDVQQPEALLFFDDLTIPTGRVPGLIDTLQRMLALAPSVCLLRVDNAHGEFFGTGFRIGKDLILTNEHVLYPNHAVASAVHADFNFDVDGSGASVNAVSLTGDVASIAGDAADDWAIVKVAGMDAAWPIIDLAGAKPPATGDFTYILQHPSGQRKRLGYVRNMITEVTDRVVHYLTDTEPGSSGAPVFDAAGQCIALHHAGGQPTTIAGKPPVSKNEGIRISRVHAALQAKGLV